MREQTAYGITGQIKVRDAVAVTSSIPTVATHGKLGDVILNKVSGILYTLINVEAGVFTWQAKNQYASEIAGTATLIAGEVTVVNANIEATDLIFVQRQDVNSSTAIGHLAYAITASTNFIISSYDNTGSLQTNDVSVVNFFIVKAA